MSWVSNAAVSIRVHLSFQMSVLDFFGSIPKSGITGPSGSYIFNFLKNLLTVFHGGSEKELPLDLLGFQEAEKA